ncbi:phosphotransferase family protein [Streptosporangium sp. NPDC001682]
MAGPQDDAAAGVELEELLKRYPDSGRLVRDRALRRSRLAGLYRSDSLIVNPLPPVLGLADGNRANYLWDEHERRVRLIDWEDFGRSDRAFELGEVCEHISRLDGVLDAEQLLRHLAVGISAGQGGVVQGGLAEAVFGEEVAAALGAAFEAVGDDLRHRVAQLRGPALEVGFGCHALSSRSPVRRSPPTSSGSPPVTSIGSGVSGTGPARPAFST